MNIKKLVRYSFITIILLTIVISTINQISYINLQEHNRIKNYLSNLIDIQKNMNKHVLDAIIIKSEDALELVEKKFDEEELKFEKLKKDYTEYKQNIILSTLFLDHTNKNIIKQDLVILYENEKQIEKLFEQIYKLQEEKLALLKSFNNNYPLESELRKSMQIKVWNTNQPMLIKEFADLMYYSKEALYQHKNETYLNKWRNKTTIIEKLVTLKEISDYKEVQKLLSKNIIKNNEILKEELVIVNSIQKILTTNKVINQSIEENISLIFNVTINKTNIVLFVIAISTIILLIILGRKVYKNVGLSVDEIETKVKESTREIRNLNKEIETTQKEVVFTMGAIGESRSKETGNHVKRVAEYSKLLALYYGLSEKEAEMLKQASPMHDIGKVAIPDSILNKPGRFDEEERKIMNTHAELGYNMLKGSNRPLLKAAAIVAYEHHEKWDGTGYPQGTKGEDIHIYGRITALADVFDALGSDRVYKKAWDDERIFNLFKEEKGKHFDPKLIDIFFEHLDEFKQIREKLSL